MAEIEVVNLSESQIEDAGRALALAFQSDPLQTYVLPDSRVRAEQRTFPRRQGHGAEQFHPTRSKRPRFSGKTDRRSLGLHYFQLDSPKAAAAWQRVEI
jgi:hypothetical protein